MTIHIHPASRPRIAPRKTTNLVLGTSADGELERDTAASQTSVDLGVCVESVVNTTALLLVEHNLQQLAAVLPRAHTLANDLDGVDQVGEDGLVDGGQCSAARTLLLQRVARAVRALGAREDTAGGDEDDLAIRELLLKLASEAAYVY